jgi:hypothetical protein
MFFFLKLSKSKLHQITNIGNLFVEFLCKVLALSGKMLKFLVRETIRETIREALFIR